MTPAKAHTAGPWHVEDPISGCLSIVDDAEHVYDWKMIANVTWDDKRDREPGRPFITKKEAKANANLIAAAPDMLAELRQQVDWLQHIRPQLTGKVPGSVINGLDQSVKYMTAAIARATEAAK